MTKLSTSFRRGWRLLAALLLALAGLGLASPLLPSAQAAPQAAGTFTVSSTSDSNTSDPFLTLREALLVAKGGTGAVGLNRAVSVGEKAGLSGCVFDGGDFITGGCGPTIADSIVFSAGLGLHPVISLTASLPAITDTAGTTIDGSLNGVLPIIAATSIVSDALLISSNNNMLSGLTIKGAPRDDLHITGNSNQVLSGTVLLTAGWYGLLIDGGKINTIDGVLVGSSNRAVGACSQGNAEGGIVLANGATTNTIQLATVACNNGVGVRFDGIGTTFNTLTVSTVTSQTGNGIEILNGAQLSQILSSTITSNSLDGVLISGAATQGTGVVTDFIGVTAGGAAAGNGHYGVRMAAGAHNNNTACPSVLASAACATYTTISGNGQGGVRLESGANTNDIGGAKIGLNPAGTAAVPNGGPGVDVDSAPNNSIGGSGLAVIIDSNQGPGIRFTNTTSGSVGFFDTIGQPGLGNGGPGVELVNTSDTVVSAELIEDNLGAGVAVEGDSSTGDVIVPLFVGQNSGLPIDLGNDGPTANGAHTPPGPNHWLNYPIITATSGSVITGTTCLNCTVLIYLGFGNPASPGGSALLWQSTTADASGHWSATLNFGYHRSDVSVQACMTPCSYGVGADPSHSDSSEISPLFALWLPLVRR